MSCPYCITHHPHMQRSICAKHWPRVPSTPSYATSGCDRLCRSQACCFQIWNRRTQNLRGHSAVRPRARVPCTWNLPGMVGWGVFLMYLAADRFRRAFSLGLNFTLSDSQFCRSVRSQVGFWIGEPSVVEASKWNYLVCLIMRIMHRCLTHLCVIELNL